jgi:hypothetical protein
MSNMLTCSLIYVEDENKLYAHVRVFESCSASKEKHVYFYDVYITPKVTRSPMEQPHRWRTST